MIFRRQMIEKIASHVADFSSRLPSNVKAVYQYCPIPAISYIQLDSELFCYIYYLRHLCDVSKFPDWPIKDPVSFVSSRLGSSCTLSRLVGGFLESLFDRMERGGGSKTTHDVGGGSLPIVEHNDRGLSVFKFRFGLTYCRCAGTINFIATKIHACAGPILN